MLPVLNIASSYSAPATLVATPIPDTNTTRVQPDTVAPAVSPIQIDANASGNNSITASATSAQTQTAEETASAAAAASANNASASTGSGNQATFLAQLVSQEIPPVLRDTFKTVLEQYEVAVANSFVKYKPSNAGIPELTPATSFHEELAHETPKAQTPAPAPKAAAAAVATAAPATPRAITVPSSPLRTSRATPLKTEGTTQLDSTALTLPAPIAVGAYAAAAARNARTPAVSA